MVLSTEERRVRLFDAAEAVFLRHGYAASSIDEISQVAGMSKATIYRWFAGKEALFLELLEDRGTELLEESFAVEENGPPALALEVFLRQAARAALSPRIVGLLRLAISEARHCPEFARSFRRITVERSQQVISRLIGRHPAMIGGEALRQTASLLYGAVIGEVQLQMLLGLDEASAKSLVDERIRQSLAAFM